MHLARTGIILPSLHILRFNVDDIDAALTAVGAYGIEAEIERNAWGNTINISDPDGNRVGVRDENTFRS